MRRAASRGGEGVGDRVPRSVPRAPARVPLVDTNVNDRTLTRSPDAPVVYDRRVCTKILHEPSGFRSDDIYRTHASVILPEQLTLHAVTSVQRLAPPTHRRRRASLNDDGLLRSTVASIRRPGGFVMPSLETSYRAEIEAQAINDGTDRCYPGCAPPRMSVTGGWWRMPNALFLEDDLSTPGAVHEQAHYRR